jgi:hypothetical protein
VLTREKLPCPQAPTQHRRRASGMTARSLTDRPWSDPGRCALGLRASMILGKALRLPPCCYRLPPPSGSLPPPPRSFRRRIEASAAAPSRFHPTNQAFPRGPGGPETDRETSTAKNAVVFGRPKPSRARRRLRSGDGSFAPRRGSDPGRGETFDTNVTSPRPEKRRCRNTRAHPCAGATLRKIPMRSPWVGICMSESLPLAQRESG